MVQPQIRGAGATHSTVLASPIKSYPPQVSTDQYQLQSRNLRKEKEKEREREESKKREKGRDDEEVSRDEGNGGGGGGSARTDSMGPPMKRVRVTRRSAAEEEQARQ